MKLIDDLLNRLTMYRLVVYGLGILATLGILFALAGRLSFKPMDMVLSLGVLLASIYVTNITFRRVWHMPTNSESWLITALILFLIVQPAHTVASYLALVLAGIVASASKFIVVWRGKHVFNPAALAAAVLSLSTLQPVTWWIGSAVLWPFSLIVGLAVVRKIRRFTMVLTFAAVSMGLQAAIFAADQRPILGNMHNVLLISPLIFLATIMLTEPATMPPRRSQQTLFAAGIAVLYVMAWKVRPIYIYPEVALLLGNIYAYVVSPKFRVRLQLQEVQQISDRVYSYVFKPDRPLNFLPGQYMEWTLPGVPYDSRGNRRTFTIASSPTEDTVQLGIKYYEPASAYKAAFYNLKPGQNLYGGQLAGDFTLKGHEEQKLVFIAGGIGITPFRSMVKYIIDKGLQCDIVLLYAVSDVREFAYVAELKAAARNGLKVIPIVTAKSADMRGAVVARLSSELIARAVPDYAQRRYYVSGPNAMVDAARHYLRQLNVPLSHIKTDHFAGY